MTTGISAEPPPSARELLRRRHTRRVSRLELASRAGTARRYVSFIERGRSVPGREIVIRLAESLDLTLRERNALLLAAGCTPRFHRVPARRGRAGARARGAGRHPRGASAVSGGGGGTAR